MNAPPPRTPRGLWLLALAGGTFTAGLLLRPVIDPRPSPGPAAVAGAPAAQTRRGSDDLSVAAASLGRLEPAGEMTDVGAPAGDRVRRMLVKEGDNVEEGQPLVELESQTVARAERDHAASRLAEAKTRVDAETAYHAARLREAECDREEARKLPAQAVAVQAAKLRASEAVLGNAKVELERAQRLRLRNAVATEDLDRARYETQRAQAEADRDRAEWERLNLARDLEVTRAEARLASARAARARALAEIPADSLAKDLERAEAKLRQAVVFAPRRGRVLKVLAHAGEPTSSSPLLKMGDVGTMYAVAEVYETDIGRVRPGHRAEVTSPALPRPVGGTVERVGLMVYKNDVLDVDPVADADSRVVEVRIRLDPSPEASALSNLQVAVRIFSGGGRPSALAGP